MRQDLDNLIKMYQPDWCKGLEDDEGYINGFFYILEWAGPLIKPPLSAGAVPYGVYPGILIIGELTPDGPRVLLVNGKTAQAYGMTRIMTLTWEGIEMFLGEGPDGKPWREFFLTPLKIYSGVYQLGWFGFGRYGEYDTPNAYEVMEDGWYKAPEKPDEYELLDEKS